MERNQKKVVKGIRSGLPSLIVRSNNALESLRQNLSPKKENIPNASLIYGVAAAMLFTIALYYFFTGLWFTGLLVFFLAAALFGYALVYMRFFG